MTEGVVGADLGAREREGKKTKERKDAEMKMKMKMNKKKERRNPDEIEEKNTPSFTPCPPPTSAPKAGAKHHHHHHHHRASSRRATARARKPVRPRVRAEAVVAAATTGVVGGSTPGVAV